MCVNYMATKAGLVSQSWLKGDKLQTSERKSVILSFLNKHNLILWDRLSDLLMVKKNSSTDYFPELIYILERSKISLNIFGWEPAFNSQELLSILRPWSSHQRYQMKFMSTIANWRICGIYNRPIVNNYWKRPREDKGALYPLLIRLNNMIWWIKENEEGV